jgi:hypothetical protein
LTASSDIHSVRRRDTVHQKAEQRAPMKESMHILDIIWVSPNSAKMPQLLLPGGGGWLQKTAGMDHRAAVNSEFQTEEWF